MQLTSSQNQIRERNGLDGQQPMNVGETERIVSMVGGAALLLYAVNRGSWPGLVAGVAGADLLRLFRVGAFWLFTHDGWLCRGTGGVCCACPMPMSAPSKCPAI